MEKNLSQYIKDVLSNFSGDLVSPISFEIKLDSRGYVNDKDSNTISFLVDIIGDTNTGVVMTQNDYDALGLENA